jgi:hypothetical protein
VDEPHTTVRVRVKPKDTAEEGYSVEVAFDASVPGRVESDEPGGNVLKRNQHAGAIGPLSDPAVIESVRDVMSQRFGSSRERGFDPDDTGSLETSKSRGRNESHEPGENVLIPDKYADDTITQRALGILDESSLNTSESTGVDPYNSGSFDKSKTWK